MTNLITSQLGAANISFLVDQIDHVIPCYTSYIARGVGYLSTHDAVTHFASPQCGDAMK